MTPDECNELIQEFNFLKTHFSALLKPQELMLIDQQIEQVPSASGLSTISLAIAPKVLSLQILERMVARKNESRVIHENDLVYVRQFPDGPCVVCHLNGAEITGLMTEEEAIAFAENYTE